MLVNYSDDLKLVQRCLGHDEGAWDELYDKYKRVCFAIAVRRELRYAFDEIFSDFVLKLIGSSDGGSGVLEKYSGRSSLKTFLSVVFFNLLIDYTRDRKRKNVLAVIPMSEEKLSHNVVPPQADDCAKKLDDKVFEAIQKLSKAHQDIVQFYYFHNLSLKEIAKLLNCDSSSVSRRLKTIRKKLKPLIEKDNDYGLKFT